MHAPPTPHLPLAGSLHSLASFWPNILVALLIAGCAPSADQAVARAIRGHGGTVTLTQDNRDGPSPTKATPPIGSGQSPSDQKSLSQLAITSVNLAHTKLSDEDLAALIAISPLLALEDLNLTHTSITDRGLAVVGQLRALRKLSLTLTAISDTGLTQLEGLRHLTELYLIDTDVTDAAVEPLSKLGTLRSLILLRTAITPAGIARLRKSLPEATIQIEPPGARTRRRLAR